MRLNAFSTMYKNKINSCWSYSSSFVDSTKFIFTKNVPVIIQRECSHFDWIVDGEIIEGRTMHSKPCIIIRMRIQQLKIVSKCNGHDSSIQSSEIFILKFSNGVMCRMLNLLSRRRYGMQWK